MALEERLKSLEAKHKHLHAMIEAAEGEKAPDEYVKKLKVDKLKVKDEMRTIAKTIN